MRGSPSFGPLGLADGLGPRPADRGSPSFSKHGSTFSPSDPVPLLRPAGALKMRAQFPFRQHCLSHLFPAALGLARQPARRGSPWHSLLLLVASAPYVPPWQLFSLFFLRQLQLSEPLPKFISDFRCARIPRQLLLLFPSPASQLDFRNALWVP